MQTMMRRLYPTDQYERLTGDFYPTPAWVTLCLLDTVPLRGIVLEPCAGQGAMAKVIADAGHQVIATDLIEHDSCIFPIVSGVDALRAPLPAGVQTILSNPPYRRDLLPRLVERWLEILNPVGGKLCLLLRSLWGESQSGQALTTRHPAYAGRVKLPRRIRWFAGTDADKGDSPRHDHCWADLGLESGSGEAAIRPLVQRSAAEGLPGLRRLARASAGRGEDLLRPAA